MIFAAFWGLLIVSLSEAQPDYAPKWLLCSFVEVGNLDSEKQAQFRILGTRRLAHSPDFGSSSILFAEGEQQFRIKTARTRWDVAKGDLILATRLPGNTNAFRYQVKLNDREIGTWSLKPTQAKRWEEHYFIIPRTLLLHSDGSMPEQLQVSLSSDSAPVYRHSLYVVDLSFLRNLRAAGLDAQNLQGYEGDLLRGIENIGLYLWREASVFLSQAARSEDSRLARTARYWLRYASFRLKPPHNDFRAGLYAYIHGWYDDAVQAFERALTNRPNDPDLLYQLALSKEYRGDPMEQVAPLFARSAALYHVPEPNLWRVSVVIYLKAKSEQGEMLEMKPEELDRVIQDWRTVETMVAAASRGHLRLQTTMRILPDETLYPLVRHGGMLLAPPDSIISRWGEYDSLISVRPGGPAVTGGADVGPNGAAVSDIGPWANWEVFLHEWNHQFDWTSIFSEVGTGYPVTHDSDLCGMQPIPTMGAGHRNSMRYYFTSAMYRRLRASAPHGGSLIDRWSLSESEPFAEDRLTPQTILTPAEQYPLRVVQEGDFQDLLPLFREPVPNRIAYTRSYIYSPKAQEVRVRLGMNDTMRVWLNGRVIYRGAYKGAAKWEDQNLPDMIQAWADLKQGWNELILGIANTTGGWGFSVRLTDYHGKPIQNLQITSSPPPNPTAASTLPAPGKLYRWRDVRDDFTEKLPRLTENDLRKMTDYPSLSIKAKIPEFVTLDCGTKDVPDGARQWDSTNANEQELNNRLNWAQGEMMAAIRYNEQGQRRDLVFLRPEAMELYLPILRDYTIERQILGYIYIQEGSSPRCLIVAKAGLGDYPYEEAGLLEP
jgi:hypothetical protein